MLSIKAHLSPPPTHTLFFDDSFLWRRAVSQKRPSQRNGGSWCLMIGQALVWAYKTDKLSFCFQGSPFGFLSHLPPFKFACWCACALQGDILTVIRRVDEHWIEAKLGDRIGICPLQFTEVSFLLVAQSTCSLLMRWIIGLSRFRAKSLDSSPSVTLWPPSAEHRELIFEALLCVRMLISQVRSACLVCRLSFVFLWAPCPRVQTRSTPGHIAGSCSGFNVLATKFPHFPLLFFVFKSQIFPHLFSQALPLPYSVLTPPYRSPQAPPQQPSNFFYLWTLSSSSSFCLCCAARREDTVMLSLLGWHNSTSLWWVKALTQPCLSVMLYISPCLPLRSQRQSVLPGLVAATYLPACPSNKLEWVSGEMSNRNM